MNDTFFECFSNWTNHLGNSYNSRYIAACARCEECKTKGYNKDEASELLAAEGFGTDLDEILEKYFDSPRKAKASNIELFIVPTKYDDIKSLIAHRLAQKGPQKVISYLTESPMPIMDITTRHKKVLTKLAERVIEEPSAISLFHEQVRPYVEETMLNSVLSSQQYKPIVKKAEGNKYIVECGNKDAIVDLEKGYSSGDRYIKGSFANFGLADEFLVAAHDHVSPYARLRKILIQR